MLCLSVAFIQSASIILHRSTMLDKPASSLHSMRPNHLSLALLITKQALESQRHITSELVGCDVLTVHTSLYEETESLCVPSHSQYACQAGC